MLILLAVGCDTTPTQTTPVAPPPTLLSECGEGFSSECVHLGEGVCFDPIYDRRPLAAIDGRVERLHRTVQGIEDRTSESTCLQVLLQRCVDHPEAIVVAVGFSYEYSITIQTETERVGELMQPVDAIDPEAPPIVCWQAYFGQKEYEQCAWDARNWIRERSGECSSLSEYCDMDYCTHFAEEFQ